MRTIEEALSSMWPAFGPGDEDKEHLTRAAGRYLSRDIVASLDLPSFDNCALDGYAVRAEEVVAASPETPVELPVRGESRAGGPLPAPLGPGAACRIFTGAPMPLGSDAVVIQEDTECLGDVVRIRFAASPGHHVRGRGSDVRAGQTLLRAGDRLWPGEIGLLASQNIDQVYVRRRPEVAILSTGDELRDLGATLEPGSIINSNVHVLTEMVRALGAVPMPLPAARDDVTEIEASLHRALEADVVITMGGVSVGAYDLVHEAFARIGIEPAFWKVRIKPGKPLTFARFEGKPIIGLPGNPVSAMVTFEVLIAPCIRKMLGDPRPHPQPVPAILQDSYRRRAGRVEIARGVAKRQGNQIVVALHERQGSGSLPSFVGVNALVILGADQTQLEAGDRVDVILWGAGLRSERTFFAARG
jgi:molybdopterin molybdotransferase